MCTGSKPKQTEPEKPELRVLLGRRQLEDLMIPTGGATQESGLHHSKRQNTPWGQSGLTRHLDHAGLQLR
jgi:hypothetical protein